MTSKLDALKAAHAATVKLGLVAVPIDPEGAADLIAVVEAAEGIRWAEFDACFTGDCDHEHANDCLVGMKARVEADCKRLHEALAPLIKEIDDAE